jgi:hypothetical protein
LTLSEPYLQVRNSTILCYNLPVTEHARSLNFKLSPTYSNEVTFHSQKRIRKAVDILLQITEPKLMFNPVIERQVMHRLSFITVTISANERHITSKEGYQLLLKPFLQKMKRKRAMITYIWKAEYQKNGQLHYHIITPSWVHYQDIQDDWNNTLAQHGFLSHWRKSHSSSFPNSTDVHAVYKINDLEAYLIKYLSKKGKLLQQAGKAKDFQEEDSNAVVKNECANIGAAEVNKQDSKGKVWDCSKDLKQAKFFAVPLPNCMEYLYEVPERICLDRCIIIKHQKPSFCLPPGLKFQYEKHLQTITNSNSS